MAEETPPPPPGSEDPFTAWYRDTIQAHPERFDPAHFTEGQARAWFPLWTGSGFRSSKTDASGNPIQGDSFDHPDECPPGTHAYGPSACVPAGYGGGGGGAGGGGGHPGGSGGGGGFGDFGGYGEFGMKFPEFSAPSYENLQSDPGYQFRLKQGLGALESSAAARGVLNTGGTLTGIEDYGQDLASQEYGQAYGRSKDAYGAKLGAYQSAWDRYRFGVDDEFRREGLLSGIQAPFGTF